MIVKTKSTTSVDVKRDILWRVYTCFIAVTLLCIFILIKAFTIQQVQGKYWRSMSDSLHEKIQEIDADRGTIYSADGQMLSTSIPQFDVYIDFEADGLVENNGKLFRENVDSLSICLANLFKDKSAGEYKRLLQNGYDQHDRYFTLKKKVGFEDYKLMKQFPLVRLGRNKSGFIADTKNIRLNPYQLLAYRTIGLDRENSQKVGLEQAYDTALKGTTGKRLVRFIAGGVAVPIDDSNFSIDPENGKDIVTTLDMHMQEIAENALMKMMVGNDATHGCAIVMEVKTGKIKAMANLGKRNDGSYWEDYNYALTPTEPGSTFKVVTLLSALEDKKVSLNDMVDLQGGTWQVNGRTVYDAEKHGLNYVTIKKAFELSSNVGLAKVAYNSYVNNPSQFVHHIQALGLNHITGIDLPGEPSPTIHSPGSPSWSATTLPWMGFGYGVEIAPMQTCMIYNAIANNGREMRPYLVDNEQEDGQIVKQFEPTVLRDSICSKATRNALFECLYGVCNDSLGTAFKLLRGTKYHLAGKTGTALVAQGPAGYSNHIYQSTLAGFFPAEDPQYTVVVVIVNKPFAAHFYGADVAGPVFKEITDQLYTMYVKQDKQQVIYANVSKNDSNFYSYQGMGNDIRSLMMNLGIGFKDSSGNNKNEWMKLSKQNSNPIATNVSFSQKQMPQLSGMGLKDALYLCENIGLKVNAKGAGKVTGQSISAGQAIERGQLINIELN
jgi:cell division protein FtsI (penicillin-binding protein 3)